MKQNVDFYQCHTAACDPCGTQQEERKYLDTIWKSNSGKHLGI